MRSAGPKGVLYGYPDGTALVWMGYGGAIAIMPECDRNANSHNGGFADSYQLSSTFENDSGHVGETLFTGSERYTVKEVEIFEFSD
jgi:hypothetical protein